MLDDILFFTDMVIAEILNFLNMDVESDREEL